MKRILGLLLLVIATVVMSSGQVTSVNGGSIQGTITDSTNALVPQATVVVSGTDTGSTKTITTDSAGFYSVGPLTPGNYTVTVMAAGFQKLAVKTVVRTGTATTGSFKLTVGQSTDTIEVTAGALQVNTDQAGVSDVITSDQIQSLPVNGRNFLDVAQIEPGVILQSGQSFDPTKAGYSAISVSGVSGRTTRILLDGQDITDEFVGTTLFNVSAGAIGDFQLNRSTQDVSGDVTSTGQVLVSTNSGTNTIHGQAFYVFQDARALFANASSTGGTAPPFQRNQFGGSVGGPIFKDKLFLFANAERIKQDSAAPISVGTLFSAISAAHPSLPSPYRETYSTGRMDYNGPLGGHYFVRGNYNVNASYGNFGSGYSLYSNRDNTYGYAGGADFQHGRITHSFRGSYEKFHNFIADATAGNASVYNPLKGITLRYSAQSLFAGPNVDAPQGTFQSDKQFRYDGSFTKGAHTFRGGYSINRIQSAAFAAFFGLAPRLSITSSRLLLGTVSASNPKGFGCAGVVGAPSCASDPINGYNTRSIVFGNGQGFSTEPTGFGLKGGGLSDWRSGAYIADSWKATPNFTVTAGLRWSVDTGRANQDAPTPLCSDVDVSSVPLPSGCTSPSTPLFSLFNPGFGQKVHQPYSNFAPQVGINYSPGDHKTSIRAGFGIFFESNVANNGSNARTNLLKQGAFFDYLTTGCSSYSLSFPDGTKITSLNGKSLKTICQEPVSQSAPEFSQIQGLYQANTASHAISANASYAGETLTVSGLYGAPYRTPYSEQWNAGIQRELFKGAVFSADYVHNSTLKVGQQLDLNHVGAARTLNKAAATAAINATLASCGASSINAAIAPNGCPSGSGPNNNASISDFANNGLDSGNAYLSGNPASYAGKSAAAFPGLNPQLGNGDFILPIGRSGYDALHVVYRQSKTHPVRGVEHANLQVSYSLSRIVSTASAGGNGSSDQFFNSLAIDNDNPTQFMGRASLDHKHEISFGGYFGLKYGPVIGLLGHFFSAAPGTLTLDTALSNGGIFQTDVTGDGTVGDIAPGTLPGDYMHRVKGSSLKSYIDNFNSTQAGKLTPAGQAVVSAGLFTPAQLSALNATVQTIAQLPQAKGIDNPTFRSMDMNFSYPIRLNRFREGLSLEPSIAFFNVFNFANYGESSGVLNNTTTAGGPINNTPGFYSGINDFANLNATRTFRGVGTFDQGASRSAEFGLKLNF